MKILFIGNSHTYYHDMPAIVKKCAERERIPCETVMLAHPCWYLKQHIKEPDVRFNIRYGGYDFVVLQERANPFDPKGEFLDSVRTLDGWIREAGSRTVLYMTWSKKNEPEKQEAMTRAYEKAAEATGAILVPVGEERRKRIAEDPDLELYEKDGEHASLQGAELAATLIWNTIKDHIS